MKEIRLLKIRSQLEAAECVVVVAIPEQLKKRCRYVFENKKKNVECYCLYICSISEASKFKLGTSRTEKNI